MTLDASTARLLADPPGMPHLAWGELGGCDCPPASLRALLDNERLFWMLGIIPERDGPETERYLARMQQIGGYPLLGDSRSEDAEFS